MNNEYILDNLVLISGVTGTEIESILEIARGDPEVSRILNRGRCIFKFEDLVGEVALGPCGDISQVIKLLLISRPSARSIFRRALERFKDKSISNKCKSAILSIHFSYLSRDVPTPNPILGEIVRLARNVKAVHISEDWYDILYTISERLEQGECGSQYSPYNFNYLTILYWRGIDMSISELLMEQHSNVTSYLYAIKHPQETTARFLRYLLGSQSLEPVYISHPISSLRRAHVMLKCVSPRLKLGDLLLVKIIEEFKKAYLKMRKNIILFDPTTIDEKMMDTEDSILHGLCPEHSVRGECRTAFTFLYINGGNRWPIPSSAPRMRKGHYKYVEDGVDLVPRLARLTGEEEALIKDEVCSGNRGLWGVYELIARRVQSIIDSHIEIRDYKYVEQSKYVIVALPAIYSLNPVSDGNREVHTQGYAIKIWLIESQGVYNELARAQALAKPIYVYLLPVNLDLIARMSTINADREAILRYMGLRDESSCKPDIIIDSPSNIEAIVKSLGVCVFKRISTPFSMIPAIARVFIAKPVITIEELNRLGTYYEDPGSYTIAI